MIWKWQCKMCPTLLDDPEAVKRHMFTTHKNILLYANPVAVDEWEVGQRPQVRKEMPKVQPKKKVEDEEFEDEEDLTLPDEE